jgi:hypothetical protein
LFSPDWVLKEARKRPPKRPRLPPNQRQKHAPPHEENRAPGEVRRVCHKIKQNKDLFAGYSLAESLFEEVK